MVLKFHCYTPEMQVTVETEPVALSQVLETLEAFLKASGYVFDGHLDIVNDDEGEGD